ncbi:unnamed protein product [Amoebophrya sp. A120]|nr:unnamed protein product [Amoebophrya sp. A120]|eukprot:GSA120T00016230001.1
MTVTADPKRAGATMLGAAKKIGTTREAPTLSELFDRRARTQDMWGKEPIEYRRLYDEDVEQNTVVHRESKLQVWRGFADLVNRTDKRYPDNRENVCVFFWTKKANVSAFLKVGKDNAIWSDILMGKCVVHESFQTAGSTAPNATTQQSNMEQQSTITRTSITSTNSSIDSLALATGAVEKRIFLGEFLTLEIEDVHQMAIKNDVRPFNDKEGYAHPTKVQLVELMTGRPYRDCLRDGTVENFEIAIPVYVPYALLGRSREESYCAAKFPYIVNIALSDYNPSPTTFWNDRLVDACADGDPATVELCFENGAAINHQDCKGWTPLHAVANVLHDRAFRAENRKKQVLDLLLQRKPSLHIRTLRGELAVDLAEYRGFALCAEVLRAQNLIPIEEVKKVEEKPDLPLVVALRQGLLF